jgi:hypothetical protein
MGAARAGLASAQSRHMSLKYGAAVAR